MAQPEDEAVYGPPAEKHPWETWTPEQRAQYDAALERANLAKNFREAGHMAQPGGREAFEQVASSGGLSPEDATTLARYRMSQMGMPNVPVGARASAPTPEETAARRDAFLKADRAERTRMLDEDKSAIERSHENYFDSLVGPPPAKTPNVTPEKIEAARKFVTRRRSRPVS